MSKTKKFKDFELIISGDASKDDLLLGELTSFAKLALDHKLFVDRFSMQYSLIDLIDFEKYRHPPYSYYSKTDQITFTRSIIILAKYKGEYVGICAYLPFATTSMNTFVSASARGMGLAYKMNCVMLSILEKQGVKKNASFFHGEAQSLFLFHKLLKNKKINMGNLHKEDRERMNFMKQKVKNKESFNVEELLEM